MLFRSVDEDAIIILGTAIREDMQDEIAITVIATGFDEASRPVEEFKNDEQDQDADTDDREEGYTSTKDSDGRETGAINIPNFLSSTKKF